MKDAGGIPKKRGSTSMRDGQHFFWVSFLLELFFAPDSYREKKSGKKKRYCMNVMIQGSTDAL
jgi:hypothetical protein